MVSLLLFVLLFALLFVLLFVVRRLQKYPSPL